uniref:Phospholipid/glycerol acyltransferase domain-containing protein n=1 Tax=Kalanchoe fedtschenkoi TaxID=63787 RepID=A0A7N0RJI1_KALFE
MDYLMVLVRLAEWLMANSIFYRPSAAAAAAKNKIKLTKSTSFKHPPPTIIPHHPPPLTRLTTHASPPITSLICDIDGVLLRPVTLSFFPFFMLVAFEAGSLIRAFLLLLTSPLLLVLNNPWRLKVMIFVTFCGLKVKDMQSVSRAVLPKFYLENLNVGVFDALMSAKYRAVVTSVPQVMVEGFLREYLEVDAVVGSKLGRFDGGKYFSGLVGEGGLVVKHRAVKELFGDGRPHVGIATSALHDHLLLSLCKDAYVVTKEDLKNSQMPREKYPKPLIFHDGRLAFLPTPLATAWMFVWLPLGVFLAIFRILIGIVLPCNVAAFLGSLSGVRIQLTGTDPVRSNPQKGVLYVCTHRTLLDPVFLSTALAKPMTAVTYSLSRMSEILAPIKTVRLTRDRTHDGETMQRLLSEGDLVVCPEGTTCREPYLLRFSSLFAELADEIVPVAVNTHVSMFYGTTASGFKFLDPIFFLMNPRPVYQLHIMEKLPKELSCAGGKSCFEVANYIQGKLGEALGFECTNLTRKDKYLMLAGNEGIVGGEKRNRVESR